MEGNGSRSVATSACQFSQLGLIEFPGPLAIGDQRPPKRCTVQRLCNPP
jgi:hypothetical protein